MNRSPSNTRRYEGCTLTGALSVTTQVRDGMTLIHGPAGCTHHNFSLLHAIMLQNDSVMLPTLLSTGLSETEIIFGGEDALEATIESTLAQQNGLAALFVLSTCIVETIGDDVGAVCRRDWGVPVTYIPTSGFLGGVFEEGVLNALLSISECATPRPKIEGRVNLIGEKNLEYEVEENYREVLRLLAAIGLEVNLRFVHDCSVRDLASLGSGCLNILRDEGLNPVGAALERKLGIPYIGSFPIGLAGTRRFIREVGEACGVDWRRALQGEIALQDSMIASFGDLRGAAVRFDQGGPYLRADPAAREIIGELRTLLGLRERPDGTPLHAPVPAPVGTAGIRRMLHRWRREIHAQA